MRVLSRTIKYSLATTAGLSALLIAGSTLAQIAPSTVEPSQIQQHFERQPESTPAPTRATIEAPVGQVRFQKKFSPFTLKSVEVTGDGAYSQSAFKDIYDDYIGKKVSMDDAAKIARAITTKYRTDGYILSQAVVPTQTKNGSGVLTIQVVEGFVNNVIIEGAEVEGNRQLIAKYAEKIRAEKPLNVKTLERYLLLMDDLPGITARGVIRPSPDTFGAADVVLQIQKKVWDFSATTDNRGTRFLGRHQHQATIAESDLFGLYERTLLRGITTSPTTELRFFDIQHEEQIGNEGTRLILLAGFTRSEPGDFLKPLNIEGSAENYEIRVRHPFMRSRKENLTGRVSFDARNSDTDILGVDISNDRVRSLRVGANYDISDKLDGVNQVDVELSQGLDIFGATRDGIGRSRTDGEHTYTKVNLDLARLQNLPRNFSLLGTVSGQYAFDPLLASEEFGLGGPGLGSAYDASEILGDHGLGARLELRYGHTIGEKYFNSLQVYGYYDLGAVWTKDGPVGADDRQSLADVGMGVRANLTENFYGYAEVAFPITRDVASEGDQDPRFFFSLTGRF